MKVKLGNVSVQSNHLAQPEHLEQEAEGDHLLRQVVRHQDQLQTDSDFIRHHSQDQATLGTRLDPAQLVDQLTDQEADQADLQPQYQTHDQTQNPQVFNIQNISEVVDEKHYLSMEEQKKDQMNVQAVTGFQLLDVLEDDDEDEDKEEGDAQEIGEEKEEAIEIKEMPEESKVKEQISRQSNRTFEDIFNEAGSFIDEEDVFMEEYERLDDQNENDSGEDNEEISVVNHFKSIKFARPIPKWP